jgi:hypothetical protein
MIRTGEQLDDAIAADLIWRKKELSALRALVQGSATAPERHRALLRSAVAILYANWEGFVRSAACAYLEYVAFQRLKYAELAPSFVALAAKKIFRAGDESRRIQAHVKVTEFFRNHQNDRAVVPYKEGISTEQNLSSEVLENIVCTLSLDFSPFELKRHIVDSLLGKRNAIAHGEYATVDLADFETLYAEMTGMLELFRNAISNAASSDSYRRAA